MSISMRERVSPSLATSACTAMHSAFDEGPEELLWTSAWPGLWQRGQPRSRRRRVDLGLRRGGASTNPVEDEEPHRCACGGCRSSLSTRVQRCSCQVAPAHSPNAFASIRCPRPGLMESSASPAQPIKGRDGRGGKSARETRRHLSAFHSFRAQLAGAGVVASAQ